MAISRCANCLISSRAGSSKESEVSSLLGTLCASMDSLIKSTASNFFEGWGLFRVFLFRLDLVSVKVCSGK